MFTAGCTTSLRKLQESPGSRSRLVHRNRPRRCKTSLRSLRQSLVTRRHRPSSAPRRRSRYLQLHDEFLCATDAGTVLRSSDEFMIALHEFGKDNIFKDVDNVPYGVDFPDHLDREIQKCDVLFVIIDPRWFGEAPSESSRIEAPNDYVRAEIASALRRNIPVVPLLVDGAQM